MWRDEDLNTEAEEGDHYVVSTTSRRRFLLRNGREIVREYFPNSIFDKYNNKCPLFSWATDKKDFVQFLLHCTERGEEGNTTKKQLTCRNSFKFISKFKLKGVNGNNSCHNCDFFLTGLIPKWEEFNHPNEVMKYEQRKDIKRVKTNGENQ